MAVTASENRVETAPVTDARPAAARSGDHGWVWQVTALSLALGILLALAIRTTERIRNEGLPSNRHGVSPATLSQYNDQNESLEREIRDLRAQLDKYRADERQGRGLGESLKKEFREHQALMGFAPVQGPGLQIRLHASPRPVLPDVDPNGYLIDPNVDVNGIISELWAAGAEAVAIAGADGKTFERFVNTTTVRGNERSCIVNGRELRPPYHIRAIGNAKTLRGALEMPQGIVELRSLKLMEMISIEESRSLVLPAHRSARASG